MWSLGGDDAGQFSITDGMLMFMTAPDYEMPMDMGGDNMYMVTVMADDGTYMDTHDVTVMVTNVDEMGMVTAISGTARVESMLTAGTVTDPDGSVSGESVDVGAVHGRNGLERNQRGYIVHVHGNGR